MSRWRLPLPNGWGLQLSFSLLFGLFIVLILQAQVQPQLLGPRKRHPPPPIVTAAGKINPYEIIIAKRQPFLRQIYTLYERTRSWVQGSRYVGLFDHVLSTTVIAQSLGNFLEFAFNGTDDVPSFTIANATWHKNITFVRNRGSNPLASVMLPNSTCQPNFTFSSTIPPYDLIIEIPGKDCTWQIQKVFIDFQSWVILRWKLSESDYIGWRDIVKSVESLRPTTIATNGSTTWQIQPEDYQRADDPCIHEYFMLYWIVGDKASSNHHVYAYIPVFQGGGFPVFMNLTGSFCSNNEDASNEECGYPEQLVLTNDHLIALTDKGIYVSSSLNRSDADISLPYSNKPLISYTLRDPCEKFDKFISCFKQGRTSLSYELIHSIRLYYTPRCYLHQYPFYEDRLILAIEHTVTSGNSSDGKVPVRAITILFSSTPYKVWKPLFIGKHMYESFYIMGLVGIFFNYQLRHFDITLKITEGDQKNIEYRRFVLDDLQQEDDETITTGHQDLHGMRIKEFAENKFPGSFQLHEIAVNPGTMDVFFMGNQLWIAEAGLDVVYKSVEGLHDRSMIQKCHFSHPDRTYVCQSSNKKQLIWGRVAAQYSPSIVDLASICSLEEDFVTENFATPDYFDKIIERAVYVAGHGGNIIVWFFFDGDEQYESQQKIVKAINALPDPDRSDPALYCTYDNICPKTHCSGKDSVHTKLCIKLKELDDDGKLLEDKMDVEETGPVFYQLPIKPPDLSTTTISTDGPLVPFLLDGATALLYEAKLPGEDEEFLYFSHTFFGKQINCKYSIIDPSKPESDKNCKLYIRHIKPTVPRLQGFRQVMYATVLKPIALVFAFSEAFILQIKNSNRVLVMMKNRRYHEYHVGWTHWFPDETAVLLQGFPDKTKSHIMWGYATKYSTDYRVLYFNDERATRLKPSSYLMDMSTKTYRDKRKSVVAGGLSIDEQEWKAFAAEIAPFEPISFLEREAGLSTPPTVDPIFDPSNMQSFWEIQDGGCHHVLELVDNPVLKGYGGRVNLDIHDSISFAVKIRAISDIGQLSMYRPLFLITNSNPAILSVEKKERYDIEEKFQLAEIRISPTGLRLGAASISIRSIMTSTKCKTPLSLTYIVQIHRQQGRRLWVNFPIPICKSDHTAMERPWKEDKPFCIPPSRLLEAGKSDSATKESDKLRIDGSFAVFFKLPTNYRPPSSRGEKIPLSPYTYNADPSKPFPNNFYHISNDTKKFNKCNFRANRSQCCCTDSDKLSDDPAVSDCKEMVYTVPRGKSFTITLDYDPVMQDDDQNPDFFVPHDHLSVYIEEINGRTEYSLLSGPTPLLEAINRDPHLLDGHKKFYNAQEVNITLHGTGLFHFKAGLGKFDTFEEATGYFTIYSDANELNHIRLVVVMLLTITCCFSCVFIGFMRVRKRLSSQLPFQTRAKTKFKVE